MPSYDVFSLCYDRFTEDVDYASRTRHLLALFERYDRKPTLLLDLACGTGGFSYALAEQGIEVIGVDASEGMLAAAKTKQSPNSTNPLFLNQTAEELELFGTVDGAVCMLDSLNHICEYENFLLALQRVSLFLEQDRLFIFDVNTLYKHEKVLADNVFTREDEDAFCVWQNQCRSNGLVDIYLDFFVRDADGRYTRYSEDFSERAYTVVQIEAALQKSGFEIVAVFDDQTEQAVTPQTERMTYIVRKK